jgi:hypothetical protein
VTSKPAEVVLEQVLQRPWPTRYNILAEGDLRGALWMSREQQSMTSDPILVPQHPVNGNVISKHCAIETNRLL